MKKLLICLSFLFSVALDGVSPEKVPTNVVRVEGRLIQRFSYDYLTKIGWSIKMAISKGNDFLFVGPLTEAEFASEDSPGLSKKITLWFPLSGTITYKDIGLAIADQLKVDLGQILITYLDETSNKTNAVDIYSDSVFSVSSFSGKGLLAGFKREDKASNNLPIIIILNTPEITSFQAARDKISESSSFEDSKKELEKKLKNKQKVDQDVDNLLKNFKGIMTKKLSALADNADLYNTYVEQYKYYTDLMEAFEVDDKKDA